MSSLHPRRQITYRRAPRSRRATSAAAIRVRSDHGGGAGGGAGGGDEGNGDVNGDGGGDGGGGGERRPARVDVHSTRHSNRLGPPRAAARVVCSPSERPDAHRSDANRSEACGRGGSEHAVRPSGGGLSGGGLSAPRGHPSLPVALASDVKARRRAARRDSKSREQFLSRAKEILIRRALSEEHPESRGDALWRGDGRHTGKVKETSAKTLDQQSRRLLKYF